MAGLLASHPAMQPSSHSAIQPFIVQVSWKILPMNGRGIKKAPNPLFFHFRHLASFVGGLATNRTSAEFVFQHGVIGGAATSKFTFPDDVANVEEYEGQAYEPENDEENIEELHVVIVQVSLPPKANFPEIVLPENKGFCY